jgi:hypothetical protein
VTESRAAPAAVGDALTGLLSIGQDSDLLAAGMDDPSAPGPGPAPAPAARGRGPQGTLKGAFAVKHRRVEQGKLQGRAQQHQSESESRQAPMAD